ncbi:MAG: DUF1841 family protein [Gammaproteobacteria bacterium]|nr:DUF1841 family protein [Gammaproteobacteria bacterium]
MLFTQDRNQLRQVFFQAWQKARAGTPLEPMEQVIANVIEQHPEYHSFFENFSNLQKDYLPEMGETNPFLHISMHLSIYEQIVIDQPRGTKAEYERLMSEYKDPHDVEHHMMDCLGEMIWKAQRENRAPNENDYLDCLRTEKRK